ncbi:MAG: hypothetical protein Q9218_007498 [Villophora microphyllina]
MATQAPSTSTVRPKRAFPSRGTRGLKFDQAVNAINHGIRKAFPKNREAYLKVSVLLFHWDTDDIGVAPLEEELADVFRNMYNFNVERYELIANPTSHNPTTNLQFALMKFCNRAAGFECILFGDSNNVNAPEVDWKNPNTIPDAAEGDKLYLFDCCFAAAIAVTGTTKESEYLAASAVEISASPDLQKCLTARFTQLLREIHPAPRTVASYHSILMSQMHQPTTLMDSTPVFVPSFSKPAIMIEPQVTNKGKAAIKALGTPQISKAQVLVTLTIEGYATVPNADAFIKYLMSDSPPEVGNIQVESLYKSNSQLFIISMPTEVWSQLPENPNINFVGHIQSSNLLRPQTPISQLQRLQIEEPQDQGAGLRPRSSRSENVPPSSPRKW